MPREYWTNSTAWPETPSAGASARNYIRPLVQNNGAKAAPSDRALLNKTARWNWSSTSATGQINYMGSVDVTDPDVLENDNAANCRAVCLYYLSKIDGSMIFEAREELRDLYERQL